MSQLLLGVVAVSTGLVAGALLLYLLYTDLFVVGYPRFFRIIALGMLVFAGSGILIGLYAPAGIHGVHALTALFVSLGLYELLRGEFASDDGFGLLAVDEFGFETNDRASDPLLDDDD